MRLLSFPLSPLQSAEHTNIYLPGAQCQEDSFPELLLHSLTKLVDAFLISRALLNTNCILPGCRDTVFRCGRERVMFWTQEQSLQRTKKKEGDRGLPGGRRKRYIYQECRTENRREKAQLWELGRGLWNHLERESGADPLRAMTLGTTGCSPMTLTWSTAFKRAVFMLWEQIWADSY